MPRQDRAGQCPAAGNRGQHGQQGCPVLIFYQYFLLKLQGKGAAMYFTDRGIEELGERRGEEQVTLGWLADRLQAFVDLHPDYDVPVDRLATWLARDDEDYEDE